MSKPKARKNKAKDVEQPKVKRIDLPSQVKVALIQMDRDADMLLRGVVATLDIKGKWSYDGRTKQIVVEDNNGKE